MYLKLYIKFGIVIHSFNNFINPEDITMADPVPSAEETLVDIKKLLEQLLDLINRRIR